MQKKWPKARVRDGSDARGFGAEGTKVWRKGNGTRAVVEQGRTPGEERENLDVRAHHNNRLHIANRQNIDLRPNTEVVFLGFGGHEVTLG